MKAEPSGVEHVAPCWQGLTGHGVCVLDAGMWVLDAGMWVLDAGAGVVEGTGFFVFGTGVLGLGDVTGVVDTGM